MSGKTKKKKFGQIGDELDLVPLIDVTFLVLLFFILCGRLTIDQRNEQITVPPTKTAMTIPEKQGWTRVVINVFGRTQDGDPPTNSIQVVPEKPWVSRGTDLEDALFGYKKLRELLNGVYDRAEKYDDPKGTGIRLPQVVVEVRADAETEWRVVQEVQQVVSDSVNPFNKMLPNQVKPADMKPFVNIDFTTRRPGEN